MEWTPPPDGIAANVLNRVVNERYLNARSILITTNKPLAALGQVLHDGGLAEAILDRGAHFQMHGRSYRTRLAARGKTPTRSVDKK